MRSLVLLSARFDAVLSPSPSSSSSPSSSTSSPRSSSPRLVATTVDPANDTTYAVTHNVTDGQDADHSFDVYRLESPSSSAASVEPYLLTSFTSPPPPSSLSSSSSSSTSPPPPVVSFHYQPEDDALAIVLANGEVEQVFLNGGVGEARRENVGTFDCGILAAEWSPDDELLALITGDNLLLLLTRTFDPLSESPLHTTSFGSDAPVSVGWGHKTTQFHGSLGKDAAAEAARAKPMEVDWILSENDDERTRVRWRGDSAWFAVSSVEEAPPKEVLSEGEEAKDRRVRRIRIFSRMGEHSSTSEPVPGLEGSLAWCPTGEMIASTQRRELPGVEGAEKEVDLRVVFFERNGLRRYEFPIVAGRDELREGRVKVRELGWNSGSDVLAVWVEKTGAEGGKEDSMQLYHRSNYRWYHKQTLSSRLTSSTSSPLAGPGFSWHPEKALELSLVTETGLEQYGLNWETFGSNRTAPEDDGTVAVVDGANTLLTPFRLLNVPPPMAALTLSSPSLSSAAPSPPVHISFLSPPPSASSTPSSVSTPALFFALLHASPPSLQLYSWALSLPRSAKDAQAKAREGLPEPVLEWEVALDPNGEGEGVVRQCAVARGEGEVTVAVLRTKKGGEGDEVLLVTKAGPVRNVGVMEGATKIVAALEALGEERDESEFVLETAQGEILEVTLSAQSGDFALPSSSLPSLPEFCPQIQHLLLPSSPSSSFRLPDLIGLAPSGRLYSSSRQLASDATSFAITPDFLIYTTFSHEAKFVPLTSLGGSAAGDIVHTETYGRRAGAGEGAGEVVSRQVERGSRIVTVLPSATSLILQMPRGNLETICPRPLVLRVVAGFLDSHRYRSAFLLCRRHRIDLNLLYDHSPSTFTAHLADFVSQVKDVDHINLFLSGLKDEDVGRTMYRGLMGPGSGEGGKDLDSANKVNTVCDLVRKELEGRDVFHYANSILTAHVRKRPPTYEDALKVLVELKAKDPERAEDAVRYIIFLSDANKLFDLALGMYDFPLVLMIAQHSQKDPREYLPFLRALRALPPFLQRHKIDDHLSRFDSALKNLARAGEEAKEEKVREEHFVEAVEYARKHGMWETALECYQGVEGKYEIVLAANAEYLFDSSKYLQAALLFQLGNQPEKALLAYQRANAWQELFTLALTTGVAHDEIKELALDVADNLTGKRRYAEAARVLLEYGQDLEAAVQALCEGNLYAEAVRLTALNARPDLLDEYIKPSTLDMQQRLLDDMDDLTEQMTKQLGRLEFLKEKREQNPYLYYCIDDPAAALENVELAPDGMSDAGTAFTRYTVAPTTQVSSTKQSSKTATSRRRAALKKAGGKKGSVYEEMYLLNSIKKTVEAKLVELQTDTSALLPILLTLSSSEHRHAAIALQSTLLTFLAFLSSSLSTIWDPLERSWRFEREEEQRIRDSGDLARLVEWEQRPRAIEGEVETKRVERPEVKSWKGRLVVLDAAAAKEGY